MGYFYEERSFMTIYEIEMTPLTRCTYETKGNSY